MWWKNAVIKTTWKEEKKRKSGGSKTRIIRVIEKRVHKKEKKDGNLIQDDRLKFIRDQERSYLNKESKNKGSWSKTVIQFLIMMLLAFSIEKMARKSGKI